MAVFKIRASRVNNPDAATFQGQITEEGLIWYGLDGTLRIYNGNPGGRVIGAGGNVDLSGLANVATSGDYLDLINLPTLSDVATSGDFAGSRHTSLGVAVNYRLNNKWKLNAGYEHYWLRYQSGSLNRQDLSVAVPTADFSDKYFEVQSTESADQSANALYVQSNQRSHQLRLGVQFELPKQFYLGTTLIGNFLGKQQEVFTRTEVNNNIVLEPANESAAFKNKGFEVKRVEGSFGRYFKIGKKSEVPVDLFYQQNLKKRGVIIPSLAGFRVGVNYGF